MLSLAAVFAALDRVDSDTTQKVVSIDSQASNDSSCLQTRAALLPVGFPQSHPLRRPVESAAFQRGWTTPTRSTSRQSEDSLGFLPSISSLQLANKDSVVFHWSPISFLRFDSGIS